MNDDILEDNDGVLLVQITVSDAEIMETAISTMSTRLAETQPALPTATATTSRAPSKIGGFWQFSI